MNAAPAPQRQDSMPTGHLATVPHPQRARNHPSRLTASVDLAVGAPSFRRELVRRPQLVHALAGSRQASLALVVAPPGYGKTTLLAEWAEHDERPFAWLPLAEHEAGQSPCLTRLIRSLRAEHRDFVIVLDDAQVLEPAVLRGIVEPAVKELPACATIALASRTEPLLRTGRLRAHRMLTEVRLQHLAMTPFECEMLLAHEGLEVPPDDIRALVRRTEGWPAALYLAAVALREDPDALASFDGQHHLVCEYLRDEVLAPLAPDLLSFAVRTAVLRELSGQVCDVVLERSGSALLLRELARVNPLLLPLDPAHGRYRWHALMGDALRAELRAVAAELEPTLHRRASVWYSRCGEAERAIDHAAATGDAVLAGDLLWDSTLAYLSTGRNDLIRSWLTELGDARIADYAPLALSASLSSLTAGDVNDAQRWSMAALAAIDRGHGGPSPDSLAAGLAVVEAMTGRNGVKNMGEVAMSAGAAQPRGSLWRSFCLLLRGISMHLTGELAAAEELLDEGITLSHHAAPSLASLCLAQRAMIAIQTKDWELAAELTDQAGALLEEWDLTRDPSSAIVIAAAAASRAHQGRIDEAKCDLRCGIDQLAALGDFVAWYGAETRILLAHASLWLADVVGARTLLAEASRCARKTPDAVVFAQWFDEAWAYMDTLAETSLSGPSSLTIAELRILRFLPSHRSFREIAMQLGVSANTVKTQAHAVYRKLGAASRSEAVAHALDAGLLGQ